VVVLGISGRSSSAAAAVAVDGTPVAAAGEAELSGRPDAGYRLTGGLPPRAAAFGLERAQAAGRDVSLVAIVDERRWTDAEPRDGRRAVASAANASADAIATAERLSRYTVAYGYGPPPLMSLNGQRLVRVGAGHAAAALTAAAMPHGDGLIIILDGTSPDAGGIFRKRDGHVQYCAPVRGAGHLARATQLVARALGFPPDAATIDALAELGAAEAPEWAEPLQQALRNDADEGIAFDAAALTRVIERASAHSPGPLTAVDHPHREVQRRRRALAASLIDRVRAIVVEIARGAVRNDQQTASRAAASIAAASAAAGSGIHVGFGGSLFVSPRVNTRLAASLAGLPASVTFSPVPENVGLALGAALAISRSSSAHVTPLTRLGLGPSFAEDEIKETLENCRIDYVYEPNWQRLLTRVSQLLSRGKVVAWFQGAMDFGPRSLGGRSILCDPSNRYARHNINEYLLQRPLDAPLAVSIPQGATADCLDEPLVSPFMLLRGRFRDDRAEHFHAALDASRACAVHTVDKTHTPELHDLLTLHREHANVAGLIHRPLCGFDVPTAATPRAAIQTLFSSAIDAMVIARFLLMKDYWLLRSEL
jgi:carbamoyltransferase